MQLEGRRQSTNVEDRRGSSTAKTVGGLGLGGIVIVGIIYMLLGRNPAEVLQYANGLGGGVSGTEYVETEEDRQLFEFATKILAGTEDVWTDIFRQNGLTYVPPKLVIFNDAVQSGCGGASASSGPFYCSADQSVYLDLSFFKDMQRQFGTSGDFAWAYVIAHEVGHHVQYLLGTLDKVHQQMARSSQTVSNQLSVRLELQADFYAGVWAYHDNQRYRSLQDGDIKEGLDAASAIGDDRLQKQTYGRTVPDSFTHGTSAQRMKWLKKGLSTGNPADGDTFSPAYSAL
ncbi:MAG: neutral zinc metallopeptidase [Bacteroidales bacterium]|nr:neutral zinc metallopeptidase [Bacteroidales bacterium]MBR5670820.1 neutral zinc metallopeptidase [Bacteroidales bacterium]